MHSFYNATNSRDLLPGYRYAHKGVSPKNLMTTNTSQYLDPDFERECRSRQQLSRLQNIHFTSRMYFLSSFSDYMAYKRFRDSLPFKVTQRGHSVFHKPDTLTGYQTNVSLFRVDIEQTSQRCHRFSATCNFCLSKTLKICPAGLGSDSNRGLPSGNSNSEKQHVNIA